MADSWDDPRNFVVSGEDYEEVCLERARLQTKLARYEAVIRVARRLADSGELGHWNHKTIVRVDGDLALELGTALTGLDNQ